MRETGMDVVVTFYVGLRAAGGGRDGRSKGRIGRQPPCDRGRSLVTQACAVHRPGGPEATDNAVRCRLCAAVPPRAR